MNDWKPSANYRKIAEANRAYYAQSATQYDSTENCVTDPCLQATLKADLDRVRRALGKPAAEIQALDACGGSGNVALKLLKHGVKVTLADISPELLDIFCQKCSELKFTPQIVCSEIGTYLANPAQTFDLIVFSSALHHLENIEQVLGLAFDRLAPGGLLFTVFDPTARAQLRPLTRMCQRLEYYVFKFCCQTSDLPGAVRRRLRRIWSRSLPDEKSGVALNNATAGMLAEYHVDQGIDDLALVARLCQIGFEVVWHERYVGSRFAWTRRLIEWLGDITAFKLLLRKPALP